MGRSAAIRHPHYYYYYSRSKHPAAHQHFETKFTRRPAVNLLIYIELRSFLLLIRFILLLLLLLLFSFSSFLIKYHTLSSLPYKTRRPPLFVLDS